MHYDALRDNPLASYADVARAAQDCIRPYLPFVARGEAPGVAGASFPDSTIRLEMVSRLLWAAAPLDAGRRVALPLEAAPPAAASLGAASRAGVRRTAGGSAGRGFGIDILARAVAEGTDPENARHWGVPGDHDQILVEMPAVALALVMAPETFRAALSPAELARTLDWLEWVNRREVPVCNWLFFGLLVNAVLARLRPEAADEKRMRRALADVESFYLGGGWYNDGNPAERRSRDHYIPWAYYFFGLLFTAAAPDFDPSFSAGLAERAREFAPEYRDWFAPDGAGLPFGRSLTYRYAQAAFWGALAYAGVEALPWDEVRGLWARNLRWWFGKPFFSETGLQEVGYTYPNRYMAERYNSPASPLWALQSFLPLALGPEHPFWTAAEASPDPGIGAGRLQAETGFILTDLGPGHRVAVSVGQWTPGTANEHGHMAEKYEKFAYSASFAFHVSVDESGFDKIAPDNSLLLSRDGESFRRKKDSRNHEVTPGWCRSVWRPFADTTVETWQVPAGPWILRAHVIETAEALVALEGGFPLPYDDRDFRPSALDEGERACLAATAFGASGIRDAGTARRGLLVDAFPNSNILHPHAVIPALRGDVPPGRSVLAALLTAHPDRGTALAAWDSPPDAGALLALLPPEAGAADWDFA